jgi:hypothetical protein
MTFRLCAWVAVSASIVGCASQGTAVRPPANSLLIGADTSSARVLIKSVDNGPTLWASPGVLTTKATITPGVHRIEVVCESEGSLHFLTGDLTIDVQPGHTYELVGSVARGANRCDVSASVRS